MNADVRPVRAGLVGYGYAGRTFHAPLIIGSEGIELCAIASSDAGKVVADHPNMLVYRDPAELMSSPDIDLVVVATPNDTHAPLALAALAAGKHVVIDKPFALTMAEARAVIAAARAADRHLCVFHNRRWDSDYLSVKAALDNGVLGDVRHFESKIDRFRPKVRDRWREQATFGAGIWFDLGPHLIDQALQIFGLPDSVNLSLAVQRDGACVDDWAHAILQYGERRVILNASMSVAGGSDRFVVHGSAGSVVKRSADQQESQLLSGMLPGAPGWGEDLDRLQCFKADGQQTGFPAIPGDQREFYRRMASAVTGASKPPVLPIEALAVMATLEAGFTSSKQQRSATLPLSQAEFDEWEAARAIDR